MGSPIGDRLAEELIHHGQQDIDTMRRIWHDIAGHTRHTRYPQPQAPGRTTTMSLLDTAIAKVDDLAAHLKTLATDAVPALEAAQSSKIAQAAEQYVLGDQAEQFIADMVTTMASKYGTPKDAPVQVAAADTAADTAAVADAAPADVQPADPTVAAGAP